MLDARVNLIRDDFEISNIKPIKKRVISGTALLREHSDFNLNKGKQESELIYGDIFSIYEEKEDWAWGQAEFDSYVGYLKKDSLDGNTPNPTHILSKLKSTIYHEPDMRSPILDSLSIGSKLNIISEKGKYVELDSGGWVYKSHLSDINYIAEDYVETAKKFIGTPYIWGGNSSAGIDCSGLVQTSLRLAGINIPRDTDQQYQHLKNSEIELSLNHLQKGDILFSDGHIGIMSDNKNFLHANAHHMATIIEPISDVVDRFSKGKGFEHVCRLKINN